MIALYIRLSMADADLDEEKEESNSIVNQRKLLYDFIKEHPEFAGEEVEEFVDDGYSGMNFDRPAFQQMINLVKQRVVTAVIVKDFSRFGRDYIEVGDYMERIFPFMGVRFLSAGDGYDSDAHQAGDDKDLEVIMKNIINTYYSRDLSDKITSTIRAKTDRGRYVYSPRAFGYLQDPADPGKVVIDPVAGKYVRLIFDLALEGKGTGRIAQELNERGIPICSVYNHENNIKGKGGGKNILKYEKTFWDSQKVARLLSDQVYAGVYVSAKTRRVVPGMKKTRYLKPGEAVTIRRHHEAIVTEEEFEKAQEVFKARQPCYAAPYKRHPLKGKIVCGNCSHVMAYHERKVLDCYFVCSLQYKAKKDPGCCRERFNETPLNDLVFNELKKWFQLLRRVDGELKEQEQRAWEELQTVGKEIGRAQQKLKSLQARKVSLYEDYSEGKITKDSFLPAKDELSAQIGALRDDVNALHKKDADLRKGNGKRGVEFQELIRKVDLFENEIILTKTMTDAFLEKLVVYDQNHVEIQWKWNDLIAEMGFLEEGPGR